MHRFQPQAWWGIYSALFTPYDRAGRINEAMLEKIVEYHLKSGLAGFYLTGTTGESLLLSEDERKQVVERVIKANAGRGKVVVHVGHIATAVAVRLARHAEKAGADAVSAINPILFGTTFDQMFRHYRTIAGATDLPFFMYSFAPAGGEVIPEDNARFFAIKNAVGLKYTGTNLYALQQLSRLVAKPHVFFSGMDQFCLAARTFGVRASIGMNQNFLPHAFVQVYRLYDRNRVPAAARVQEQINRIIFFLSAYRDHSYTKAVMRYIGFDCGGFRLPYKQLSEKEYCAFARQLEKFPLLHKSNR